MLSFESVPSRLLFWIAGTTGILFAAAILYSFVASRAIVLDDTSKLALATAETHASRIAEVLSSVEEGTRLTEKLVEKLSKNGRAAAGDIADGVLAAVKSFAGSAPQSDDITVMAVRYRTRP